MLSCSWLQVSNDAAFAEATLILEANPNAHESVFGASSSLTEDNPLGHLKAEMKRLLNEEEEEEQEEVKAEDGEANPEPAPIEDEGVYSIIF